MLFTFALPGYVQRSRVANAAEQIKK